jgi:FkbM family methyltransferase
MYLSGYREDGDLIVPSWDRKIAGYLRGTIPHLDLAVSHCKARRVAVQAGGNCGLAPRHLSTMFNAVYTFEPDPASFVALAVNTAECPNVIRFQAALGDMRRTVGMNHNVKNCGAYYVDGDGILPVMKLDDLVLPACDLIYLDVEGCEMEALRGANRTIGKFRPVIAFEDKGLGQRYGVEQGVVTQSMQACFGYRVADVANHDVIMVPA